MLIPSSEAKRELATIMQMPGSWVLLPVLLVALGLAVNIQASISVQDSSDKEAKLLFLSLESSYRVFYLTITSASTA
jgi:hypothetical protein